MNTQIMEHKPQRWRNKLFHQSRFKKPKKNYKEIMELIDEKTKPGLDLIQGLERFNSAQWIKTILTRTFRKSPSKIFSKYEDGSDSISTVSAPLSVSRISLLPDNEPCKSDGIDKEGTLPNNQLQYKAESTSNQRIVNKRIVRPFEPTYEIELQGNQWLQLDLSTSKQIERMRRKGFSKITVRGDTSLKKHIINNTLNKMDVLLEISLYETNDKRYLKQLETEKNYHQTHYSVRRTFWWQTSDEVGKAYIPSSSNVSCCFARVSDTSPLSAVSDNNYTKPLRYADPPHFLEESTIPI